MNMSKCLNREQAIDYIVKEFNLLPYQEYVLRNMMTHKYCFVPHLRRDIINVNSLLAMADLIRNGRRCNNDNTRGNRNN